MCVCVPADESEPGVAVVEGVTSQHPQGGGGRAGLRVTGRLISLPHRMHPLSAHTCTHTHRVQMILHCLMAGMLL